MEENQTKICPNCKRDIPMDNYLIHSVHCAKNIRVCPVCKEPVPATELMEHHEKMHKLLPCKKCGEAVCGADLEDHIRDSCALTAAVCRHCQLELPRKEMPAHESYCGTRTEQCADCEEYVMIKYRQIHLDSNHGFLKLDDDPSPAPRNQDRSPCPSNGSILRAALNGTIANMPSTSRPNYNTQKTESCTKNLDVTKSITAPSVYNGSRSNFNPFLIEDQPGPSGLSLRPSASNTQNRPNSGGHPNKSIDLSSANSRGDLYSRLRSTASSSSSSSSLNEGAISRSISINNNIEARKRNVSKRTNDQPQINTSVEASNKVDKNLVSQHRGAIKKRQAPRPPSSPQNASVSDRAYWSATARAQQEEKKREEQSALNVARGLPPVLSPAAKLEKLRKLDALHNREIKDEYQRNAKPMKPNSNFRDFANLKPMTNEEFMNRFEKMGLKNENRERERLNQATNRSPDRFNEIKRDLRELRRDLNEVTAPYNAGIASSFSPELERQLNHRFGEAEAFDSGNVIPEIFQAVDIIHEEPHEANIRPQTSHEANIRRRPLHDLNIRPQPLHDVNIITEAPREVNITSEAFHGVCIINSEDQSDDMDVELPCEFCDTPVAASRLVLHQTGCRPDLARFRPRSPPRGARPRDALPEPEDDPVIPCEFCTLSLPVHLVAAHQINCGMLRNRDDSIEMLD